MQTIHCVIIEDNPADAAYLQQFISENSLFNCLGVFENALDADHFVRNREPQVIFLDIDMPLMNGIDYFKTLVYQPICIFVTAHSEFAWEGFEAQAFDFILKPVKKERFQQVTERLKEYLVVLQRADLYDSLIEENTVTIKEGPNRHIINLKDILYLEALKDYSKVVTLHKKIMTLSKLKHFLDKLPQDQFIRVHRSYAVARNKITRSDTHDVYINDTRIPVGKTFRQTLKNIL